MIHTLLLIKMNNYLLFLATVLLLCIHVTRSQEAPQELWSVELDLGASLTGIYAHSDDIIYVFTASPATVQTFSAEYGTLEETFVIPPIPDDVSRDSYKISQATAYERTNGVLEYFVLVIDDGCTPPEEGQICTGRVWVYEPEGAPAERVRWEYISSPVRPNGSYGHAAISNDGTKVAQHFQSEAILFDATTGDILWQRELAGNALVGGTFVLNDSRIVFNVGGGRMVAVSASDGSTLQEYVPNNPCGEEDVTPFVEQIETDISSRSVCSNLFVNPFLNNAGTVLYTVDDALGLSSFNPSNIGSGPTWNTQFATTDASKSFSRCCLAANLDHYNMVHSCYNSIASLPTDGLQQTVVLPAISSDDTTIFASAWFEFAAVRTNGGTPTWIEAHPGGGVAYGQDLKLSGEYLYTLADNRIRANVAASGELYWQTSGKVLYNLEVRDDVVYGGAFKELLAFSTILGTEQPSTSSPTGAPSLSSDPPSLAPITMPPTTMAPTMFPSGTGPTDFPSVGEVPTTDPPVTGPPSGATTRAAGLVAAAAAFMMLWH